MFTLRFDMRTPSWAAPTADLYAAAIDMCAWAETRGAVIAVLSEHHGADDGHLPTPLILAAAIAARTSRLTILLAAVPLPLWDPVRLAGEINVLDLISKGRVSYVFGIGHRREEYDHFGVGMATRGRVADEILSVPDGFMRGEPIDYQGRQINVTPRSGSANGPTVMIAGGSRAAARRAAGHGLGFISQTDAADLKECYESQCRAAGHEPGLVQFPVPRTPTTVFVADDLDEAWDLLGPHLLHDAVMAACTGRTTTRWPASPVPTPSRNSGRGIGLTASSPRTRRPLPLHPLCGGIAPDAAWRYLKLAAAATVRAQQ